MSVETLSGQKDQRQIFLDLQTTGKLAELKALQPTTLISTIAILNDWFWIAFSTGLTLKISPYLIPFSLVIIGSKQRALSNLVHDGAHGNLFRRPHVNTWMVNIFAALPMFDTVTGYKKSHMKHHQYLGSLEKDPDARSHFRYGYNDTEPSKGSALKLYLRLIFNFKAWRDSVGAGFFSLAPIDAVCVSGWWLATTLLFTLFFSINTTLTFMAIWFVSRATAYHAIRMLSEFLDHTGLPVGSVLGFTRNLPHRSLFGAIFHPHEDTYHLTHHLLPRVPHYHLAKAHHILSSASKYQAAHHCDSYFTGPHSAMKCWMAKCSGGSV